MLKAILPAGAAAACEPNGQVKVPLVATLLLEGLDLLTVLLRASGVQLLLTVPHGRAEPLPTVASAPRSKNPPRSFLPPPFAPAGVFIFRQFLS